MSESVEGKSDISRPRDAHQSAKGRYLSCVCADVHRRVFCGQARVFAGGKMEDSRIYAPSSVGR